MKSATLPACMLAGLFLMFPVPTGAGVLISEIACETSGDDWVELRLEGGEQSSCDVSSLYVTMYYGTNEPLSADPVTVCNYDRPETPYDDRFVVVHLTRPGVPDETDLTGDTDRNGRIDVYCANYSGSLWNSDCVVAVDTDDDPANGGIIDFAAWSTRDGSVNDTIASYVESAIACGQWAGCTAENIQMCMTDTGPSGVAAYMSIARRSGIDSNGPDDFIVTAFQTPGRENVFPGTSSRSRKLFVAKKKKITMIPTHPVLGSGNIELTVLECCNIRFRIFTATGLMIYESPLFRDVFPGAFTLHWDQRGLRRDACTGLYLGIVEATSRPLKRADSETLYIILSRYR